MVVGQPIIHRCSALLTVFTSQPSLSLLHDTSSWLQSLTKSLGGHNVVIWNSLVGLLVFNASHCSHAWGADGSLVLSANKRPVLAQLTNEGVGDGWLVTIILRTLLAAYRGCHVTCHHPVIRFDRRVITVYIITRHICGFLCLPKLSVSRLRLECGNI